MAGDNEQQLAQEALTLAKRQDLTLTPRAYTVLYEALEGEDASLKVAFEGMLAEGKLNDSAIDDLYDAHCSEKDPYAKANTRMARLLGKLAKEVRAGSVGAKDFNSSLKALGDKAEVVGGSEVSGLITEILAETEKMMDINSELENRLIESAMEVEKLRADLASARQTASLDGLTGLPNRREFDRKLARMMKQSSQTSRPLSMVLVDIDHFKQFNDKHGHLVGDHVLKLVGAVLKDGVRDSDMAARYGGEEFVVLLPETDLLTAGKVAEKLREAIKGKKLKDRRTGGEIGRVTASLGVAQYVIGEDDQDFIMRTDDALYASKSSGRDKVSTERDIP